MRYAVILDGIVANVALADADFAAEQGWVAVHDTISSGWSFDGKDFTPPPPPPDPEEIPAEEIRRRLLKLVGVDAAEEVKIADVFMANVKP